MVLFLDNCDLGGYNSNKSDVPLLVEEFLRAEIEFSSRSNNVDFAGRIIYPKKVMTDLRNKMK